MAVKIYVICRQGEEYNDSYMYDIDGYSVQPECFSTLEKAKEEINRLNKKYLEISNLSDLPQHYLDDTGLDDNLDSFTPIKKLPANLRSLIQNTLLESPRYYIKELSLE
jgi:hypothetical protein